MTHKVILRRLLAVPYFLSFSVLLLGLAHYSYRAKELLVCWFLFCSLFAVLALLFLTAVLAWYAGLKLVELSLVAKTLAPNLALWLSRLLQEAVPRPRIIVAGTLETVAIPSAAVAVLDPHSYLVVEIAPAAERDVLK
jgi:hypothetical protein